LPHLQFCYNICYNSKQQTVSFHHSEQLAKVMIFGSHSQNFKFHLHLLSHLFAKNRNSVQEKLTTTYIFNDIVVITVEVKFS